ncbi:LysR family transcriptional regulator [Ectothiorhodospiraceae bacterium WFHF3C12]|nr:LysR family transcriptional regulator [Ectothiorhodospiraceae bacterium WFHF3C12]
MDRLHSMEVFRRVAEEGGFSAAGRILGLSKSVVSKQVQALEQHLGVRLLNRTTRRLSLTEAGQRYLERCVTILDELEDAERAITELTANPRGILRINVPVSFGLLHMTPLLPEFLRRYPEMEVEVTLNDRFVDLVDEGFDAAVRITQLEDSTLMARRLAPCTSWLCASPDYLARHGRPGRPEDLARHNCLIYAYARQTKEWRFIDPDGQEHRVSVHGNLRANNGELLLEAACQGEGIVLMPDFIAYQAVREGRVERLLTDFTTMDINVYAVYPYTRHVSAKVRVFVDYLAEKLGSEPVWRIAADPARAS